MVSSGKPLVSFSSFYIATSLAVELIFTPATKKKKEKGLCGIKACEKRDACDCTAKSRANKAAVLYGKCNRTEAFPFKPCK